MADKKTVIASLEKQIKNLETEIARLKEIASKVGKESTRILAEVETLENEENILKLEFTDIKKSGDAWKDLELGVHKQLEELSMNLNTAINKFKDRIE